MTARCSSDSLYNCNDYSTKRPGKKAAEVFSSIEGAVLVMFARLPPSNQSDLVEHASRFGIRLKSSGYMRNRVPSAASSNSLGTSPSVTSNYSLPTAFGQQSPATTYIHDVVVKLGDTGNRNYPQSPAQWRIRNSQSNEHPTRSNRSHYPSATVPRIPTANFAVLWLRPLFAVPIISDKGIAKSSQGPERLVSDLPMTSSSKPWNLSEQNLRFEAEKVSKIQNRTRKRTSEISGHRVDRMYYMCGSSLNLSQKYSVDPMEFARLQQMTSRSRGHRGGKGFKPNERTIPGDIYYASVDDDEVPSQPPPSSMTAQSSIPENGGAAGSDVDSVSEPADSVHDVPQKNKVEDERGKEEIKEESSLEIVGESKNMSARGKESELEKEEEIGGD
ncbi:hypothetical protein CAPTEDRAFT_223852 [Capitella teleta]|uniref:Uncharacterized protein n=1 Tax=Capitella teleta TaxID=283909 RepID=R7VCV5_CAPTE|nr:hypothetical protein CAPTEDRAFT_223852 [Capitella teleta]|eukprot:ELU16653.1 hypothetical protein CAPTEDRAFT_223852 [Capitella teleta]